MASSALKRAYRDILIGDRPDVVLVYLKGSKELIARRMRHAKDISCRLRCWTVSSPHWRSPEQDEHPIVVSIEPPPDAIVDEVVRQLKDRTG